MKRDDLDKKLKNLNIRDVQPPLQPQLKLAIISSKKSSRISLSLLAIPFLVLLSAMSESFFHVLLPPWSIIKTYGHLWPVWLRIGVFVTILIVIPLTAALINLLSTIWIDYNRDQSVLHIAIRIKKANMIILFIAALLAILFMGHSIADLLNGHD